MSQIRIEFFRVDVSFLFHDEPVYENACDIKRGDNDSKDAPHDNASACNKEFHRVEHQYLEGYEANIEKCKAEYEALFLECI